MKCEECTALALEEFLDGELDSRRAAETRAHLAACRACTRAYDELLDEQAMYAGYERDLDVTPQALWAGVAARLDGEPPQPSSRRVSPAGASFFRGVRERLAAVLVAPRFSPALTAAFVLLAVGLTVAVMRHMNAQFTEPTGLAGGARPSAVAETTPGLARHATPEATPTSAPPEPQASASPGEGIALPVERRKNRQPAPHGRPEAQRRLVVPFGDPAQIPAAARNDENLRRHRATEQLVREAEAKYLAAIRMLSEDVNRKRTRLDPQMAARFDETLAAIDRSIAETRRGVLRQRNDPIAVQYMLSAYARKVEVMREMAALD